MGWRITVARHVVLPLVVMTLSALIARSQEPRRASAESLLPLLSEQVRADVIRETSWPRPLPGESRCSRCRGVIGGGYSRGECCCCGPFGAGAAPVPGGETEAGQTPPGATPSGEDYAALAGSLGAASGPLSAAPHLIGDLFGGSATRVVLVDKVSSAFHTYGYLLPNNPGVLAFERKGTGTPNDFYTQGPGIDTTGDGYSDTYAITEPLPPNQVPTSPGPAYRWDGGKVVYTGTTAATTPQPQTGPATDGQIWYASYSYSETLAVQIPAGGGAVLRRLKIAEDNSPLPRDRVYWDFNYFENVSGGFGDVRRHTFGVEKTCFDGLMSFDVRLPLSSTLASDQNADGPQVMGSEIGNLTVIWKTLLSTGEAGVLSGGLGVGAPTGRDTNLFRADGRRVLHLGNQATHLLPYLAGLWMPNSEWFVEGFAQLDIDANGNSVDASLRGGDLPRLGRLYDATLLYADGTVGCWLARDPRARLLTGIAPVVELHYATTLQDTATLQTAGLTITSGAPRFDIVNVTTGTHFLLGERWVISPALAFPLRQGTDRQFDYEALVQVNRSY